MLTRRLTAFAAAIAFLFVAGKAAALSGGPSPGAVSSSTLTLPGKPASPKGLADDASVSVFSGQVSYSIPIDLPSGRAGFGPNLALNYSGELGDGPLGIGWRLGEIAIKRSLRQGVPTYTNTDEFELVGIGGGGRLVSDNCTENRFWVEGHGQDIKVDRRGSWWEIQDGKGTRYLLGFSDKSRQADGARVYAWFAEIVQDVTLQQRIEFSYKQQEGSVLLTEINWGPQSPSFRFRMAVEYEPRADQSISWARGFAVRSKQRVKTIRVQAQNASGGTREELRAYAVEYAPDLHLSRIAHVRMTGRGGLGELPALTFGYVPSLTSEKRLAEGTEDWRLNDRGVSVFDVDGDGMSDLYRAELGNHTWRKNLGGRFDSTRDLPGAGHTDLESVRFMDLDGDARPELVTIVNDTWRVYSLRGQGNDFHWEPRGEWPGTTGVALSDPNYMFADLNGDGRTDVLQAGSGRVAIRLNSDKGLLPAISRPQLVANAADVEPGSPNVRLQDFNGDSLADVIYFTDAWAKVWLGRGDGTFADYTTVDYPWASKAFPTSDLSLEDLDRDGLLDLIRTTAGHVTWFPGRPGAKWSAESARLLVRPTGDSEDAVVTTGDLDGDGASDVIWSAGSGLWIMDFASTGNAGMLETIDNGLGKRTSILYMSSATLSVNAEVNGHPWEHKLPASIPVPVRTEVKMDGEPTRMALNSVSDGFWDGVERRFGGFLRATQNVPDLLPKNARESETRFHPGLGRQRVLRGQAWFSRVSNREGLTYSETSTELEAKPFDGCSTNPLLNYGVTLSQSTTSLEGVSTPIVVRTTFEHDAKGRVIVEKHLGRLDMPGDEKTIRRSYADGEIPWVRNLSCEEVLSNSQDVEVSRARSFFADATGNAVTAYSGGVTPGKATQCTGTGLGWSKRTEAYFAEESRFIEQSSRDYDQFGNPTRMKEGGVTRTLGYDTTKFRPISETVNPSPSQSLTWSMEWDEVQGLPKKLTDPNQKQSFVQYDSLGRVSAVGQGAYRPHIRFEYDWVPVADDPLQIGPRTTTFAWDGALSGTPAEASFSNGWRQSVSVTNGAGDELYQATRLSTESSSDWIISGWKERDARGRVVLVADPFYSGGLQAVRAPTVPVQKVQYDALDRPLRQELPNGGEKSFIYKAFEATVFASQQAPVSTFTDGLGRIMHTKRTVNGDPEEVVAEYDGADRITKMVLQGGRVTHSFNYDSLGRLIRAHDEDIGVRTMTYDDNNWLRTHTNGAQQTVGFDYDSAGRLTKRYEVVSAQQSQSRAPVSFSFFYDQLPDASSGVSDVVNLDACKAEAGNLQGRLSWVLEPQGLTCFGYDEMGRQNLRQRVIYKGKGARTGEFVESVGHSAFSAAGSLLSETFEDGFKAFPEYDRAGRLTSVKGEGNEPFWSVHSPQGGGGGMDAAGRVMTEKYGNGVIETYQRDVLGMPKDIQITRPTGVGGAGAPETIFHTSILRNLYGAPTSITDLDSHGLDHTATYGYDLGARLTTATVGQAANQYSFRYAYDGLQNMIRRAASGPRTDLGVMVGYYRHDDNKHPRQLTKIDSPLSSLCGEQPAVSTFGYDQAGRMVLQAKKSMQFDGFDQLLKVDEPSVPSLEYSYGFEGFRTWRSGPGKQEFWFSAGDVIRDGKPEHVITVGDRLVARVRAGGVGGGATGAVKWNWDSSEERKVGRMPLPEFALLVLVAGLCAALAVMSAVQARRHRHWAPAGAAGMVAVLLEAMVAGGCGNALTRTGQAWTTPEVTYVHHGVSAGPVLFTRPDGSVLDERRYEPFGGDLDSFHETADAARTGSGVAGINFSIDPQNLLNKETDKATGWSYHGARWMASSFAMWLSPDPPVKAPDGKFMGAPWGLNPYQYVSQNPIIFWDPDGNRDAEIRSAVQAEGAMTPAEIVEKAQAILQTGINIASGIGGAIAYGITSFIWPDDYKTQAFASNLGAAVDNASVAVAVTVSAMPAKAPQNGASANRVLTLPVKDSIKPAGKPAEPSPTGKAYSVAFEMELNPADLGRRRGVHFNRANAALDAAIQSDPEFASLMESLIPGVGNAVSTTGGRDKPSGWIWHHAQANGVLQLVPEAQHTPASIFWGTMHPEGRGGYSVWAIPAGAPKN